MKAITALALGTLFSGFLVVSCSSISDVFDSSSPLSPPKSLEGATMTIYLPDYPEQNFSNPFQITMTGNTSGQVKNATSTQYISYSPNEDKAWFVLGYTVGQGNDARHYSLSRMTDQKTFPYDSADTMPAIITIQSVEGTTYKGVINGHLASSRGWITKLSNEPITIQVKPKR